jgi:hypothetical protein
MANQAVNRPDGLLDRLVTRAYGDERPGEWSERIRTEESEMTARMVRLAELMLEGTPASDPAVLGEVEWYYQSVQQYGGATPATFRSLGDALVDDEQIRALFDDIAEGLAVYQRDAISAYADTRLAEGGA